MRALAGRAVGAVGDRHEARRQRRQPLDRVPQRRLHLRIARREEFERHGDIDHALQATLAALSARTGTATAPRPAHARLEWGSSAHRRSPPRRSAWRRRTSGVLLPAALGSAELGERSKSHSRPLLVSTRAQDASERRGRRCPRSSGRARAHQMRARRKPGLQCGAVLKS